MLLALITSIGAAAAQPAPVLLPEGGLSANPTLSDILGRSFRVGVRFRTK
nr:hypothetical protein [uncultured Sandarakinorhabdus sp.]